MKQIIEKYESYLNDGSSFYAGDILWDASMSSIHFRGITVARLAKKVKNAQESYATNVFSASDLLVFFDGTIFGSGDNGFCLTDTTFSFKSSDSDNARIIYLPEMETVRHRPDDAILTVNGKGFEYGNKSFANKMEVFATCLKEYIAKYRK